MTIMFDDRQDRYDTSNIQKLIESVVSAALASEGVERSCQISITFTDNEGIREINREYRNIDSPTDVLSFPLLEDGVEGTMRDMDMDTGELVLGDIVISLTRAHEQAEEYGHSFEREVAYLTVHGMLHLLGYDHEDECERKTMRDREEKILDVLNLHR